MTYIVRWGKLASKAGHALGAMAANKARGAVYGAMSDAELAQMKMRAEDAKKKKKKSVFGALSDREARAIRREPKGAIYSKMPRK